MAYWLRFGSALIGRAPMDLHLPDRRLCLTGVSAICGLGRSGRGALDASGGLNIMRKFAMALFVAGLMAVAVPAAAHAETDSYTPVTSTAPTLAGSIAAPLCADGAMTISYSITLTDPGHTSTGAPASLVLSDGARSTVVPLGALTNNHLAGSVAWPAASWTHGAISAQLKAGGASLAVPLSYSRSAAACATTGQAAGLATTGMSDAILPIGIAAIFILIAGVGIVVTRRIARR